MENVIVIKPITAESIDFLEAKHLGDAKAHSKRQHQNQTNNGNEPKPIEWADPKPIQGGLAPVDSFDIAFMPSTLGPWIEDIANRLQCPPDYVAVAALTSLGSLIGRRAGIKPQQKTDWIEVPNVWAALSIVPGC